MLEAGLELGLGGERFDVGLVGGRERRERHGEGEAVLALDFDRAGAGGLDKARGDRATVGIGPLAEIVGVGSLKGETARELKGNQASEELEWFHIRMRCKKPAKTGGCKRIVVGFYNVTKKPRTV
jgi:hypothetical protein